ncbi:MAG: DNA polymerase II large subunit [Candidatus Pacearchaeota archaeon]|jgi:DNA polymerase II large subunit
MTNSHGFLPETEKYFEDLGKEIAKNYEIAEKARALGLDPVDKVEVPLALTMASKVIKLIATKYAQLDNEEIINRILDLEKQYGALDNAVSFTIAREIAQEKYCKFKTQMEAIDAAIRIAFAYNTLGVVSSPIEGFTEVKTGKTQTGETYLKAFFSGPIRSAGTTASCVIIILIDYLRQLFGYARYDPTEKECKRTVTELYDFHERVNNLQYLPTEEEAYFIAQHLPVQIAGDPTEKKEVSNYKNLPRIETDFIRGGFCLILGEGMAQKAAKGLRILKGLQKNGFKINDWDWLEEYVKLHEKRNLGKTDASPTYIKDLVAGRPVFGYPGKGFRFRYGRGRVAGFSAVSVHPATMAVTNDFIATGTQLKIEKPTKGCVVTVCDKIEGPIIKLKNGSVKRMRDYEETKSLYNEIEEIIYLGDILFPLGDVMNRNALLISPGYVEEWWDLELQKAGGKTEDFYNVSLEKAIEFSEKYSIPLHPLFTFYWTQITWEEFLGFIDWVHHSRINNGKLLFPYNKSEKERFQIGKRALELLGVPHEVGVENIILDKVDTKALLINLGVDKDIDKELQIDFNFKDSPEKNVLNCINKISKFKIKDKAGEFIGSRMGRPEKAKLRKLTGSPNVLFSIGEEGGRLRSANEATNVGFVNAEYPFNYCRKCNRETIYRVCEICNERTEEKFFCKMCKSEINTPECEQHKIGGRFKPCKIDMKHYFEAARDKLNYLKTDVPPLIKGIRGTSSEGHDIENFVKGILRAKYNLCVNKEGTIRYDMTELPISHFKPKEIEVGVDKLRELGYLLDWTGKELVSEEQILELKPHDVIIPCNNLAGDEKADDVFMNVTKFIDELLVKFYSLPAFYNVEKRSDLIGKLCVCMAPHNCAGVIGRIIGFSKVQGLVASPYMHAAMRRDCDGDEAAIMLLLDVLINFSRKFLPAHRGGTQDAPLVLNGQINAREVDDQILDFELVERYPLELYEKAEQKLHSGEIHIEMVKQRIARGEDPFIHTGFTHDTENFNLGATCSSYKTLPTMQDKVKAQMDLCSKLRSVNQGDVARLIIDRHFIRDLKGNLRKFSQQSFRCGKCNEIYRRPPLNGKCEKCGNQKLIFTISYGSIIKYLEPALELTRNYDVPIYITQDLELTKKYIESIFGKDTEKQKGLGDFI